MPVRTIFRDPISGRFISRAAAEELEEVSRLTISDTGVTEQPFSFFEDDEPELDPYYVDAPSKWGGRMEGGSDGLDIDRLGSTPFPDGYDSFRVTFVGVPRYSKDNDPRGAMNGTWEGRSSWPPDESWLEDYGAEGIGHIVFRRTR